MSDQYLQYVTIMVDKRNKCSLAEFISAYIHKLTTSDIAILSNLETGKAYAINTFIIELVVLH